MSRPDARLTAQTRTRWETRTSLFVESGKPGGAMAVRPGDRHEGTRMGDVTPLPDPLHGRPSSTSRNWSGGRPVGPPKLALGGRKYTPPTYAPESICAPRGCARDRACAGGQREVGIGNRDAGWRRRGCRREKAASGVFDVPSLTADAGAAAMASLTAAARMVRTRSMVGASAGAFPRTREEGVVFPVRSRASSARDDADEVASSRNESGISRSRSQHRCG